LFIGDFELIELNCLLFWFNDQKLGLLREKMVGLCEFTFIVFYLRLFGLTDISKGSITSLDESLDISLSVFYHEKWLLFGSEILSGFASTTSLED